MLWKAVVKSNPISVDLTSRLRAPLPTNTRYGSDTVSSDLGMSPNSYVVGNAPGYRACTVQKVVLCVGAGSTGVVTSCSLCL